MYVVLLGPPGSGKGTQAALLARRLHVAHISSGELLRATAATDTPLGREVAAIQKAGKLVPDAITLRIVAERLQQPDAARGALLDGFPRTEPQATALDEELRRRGRDIDRAVLIVVPEDVLVRRLSSRWISRKTGETFNVDTLGQSLDEIRARLDPDDELYQRSDDTPETAVKRIQVYNEQTLPLVEYYRRRGVLREVDGNRDIDRVQRDLLAAIEGP